MIFFFSAVSKLSTFEDSTSRSLISQIAFCCYDFILASSLLFFFLVVSFLIDFSFSLQRHQVNPPCATNNSMTAEVFSTAPPTFAAEEVVATTLGNNTAVSKPAVSAEAFTEAVARALGTVLSEMLASNQLCSAPSFVHHL